MHERARRRLVAEILEGTRRGASRTTCKRCGAPCLTGDDNDEPLVLTATVDEDPVDQLGEMFARLDGLQTYELLPATGKHRPGQHNLWHRDEFQLASGPHERGTLHTEHRCRRQDDTP